MTGQREVVLIFGQTGSGKTYTARQLFKTCPRAIVAECGFNEFDGVRFSEFPAMVAYLDRIGAFRSKSVPFRVSYSPRLSEQALPFLTALEVKNCWLFLEEADRYDDPRRFPEYDEVITRGRHHGVSLCCVGLHPFKLPKELRRQSTRIISFRQLERTDIEWLAEHVGESAYSLPELSGPPETPPHPYLIWDAVSGAQIVKLPK